MRRASTRGSSTATILLVAFVSAVPGMSSLCGGETAPPCRLEQYIDEASLLALAEAESPEALHSAWRGLPYHDLVHRAVYYTRLARLEVRRANELALLETIPTSPLEFEYLYAINDTRASRTHAVIRELYDTYFKTIGRLAAKHTDYIEKLLVMNRFADGESKNDTDEATRILKELNREGYLGALKKLDPDTRAYVCGDCPELQGGSTESRQ